MLYKIFCGFSLFFVGLILIVLSLCIRFSNKDWISPIFMGLLSILYSLEILNSTNFAQFFTNNRMLIIYLSHLPFGLMTIVMVLWLKYTGILSGSLSYLSITFAVLLHNVIVFSHCFLGLSSINHSLFMSFVIICLTLIATLVSNLIQGKNRTLENFNLYIIITLILTSTMTAELIYSFFYAGQIMVIMTFGIIFSALFNLYLTSKDIYIREIARKND